MSSILSKITSVAFLGSTWLALTAIPSYADPIIILEDSFDNDNGALPVAPLLPAGDGIFYGVTTEGGLDNFGAVFEFDVNAGAITIADSFNNNNGASPLGALASAGNNIFYGTTSIGGANNKGGIFEFNQISNTTILKASFNGDNGETPQSIIAAGGNIFYGTTLSGGNNGFGVIFEFNATTNALTVKANFNGSNGAEPYGKLLPVGNGIYFGTASKGGDNDLGVIYEFNAITSALTAKASFDGSNGANPTAMLTFAGDGIYYGTTEFGGQNDKGAIFQFDSFASTITHKASFNGTNGDGPLAELTAVGGGVFYGTTYYGGSSDLGVVYALDSNTDAITIIDSFIGSNGAHPSAGLTTDGSGVFYGTTEYGGENNRGAIYSLRRVPGPMPLFGAVAAFHGSRRLRRRIKSAAGNRSDSA